MANSNPLTNLNQETSIRASSMDHSLEDVTINFRSLHIIRTDETECSTGTNLNRRETRDRGDDQYFQVKTIINQKIEEVLDEGNSANLEKSGSINVSQAASSYQPGFETKFNRAWRERDSIDCDAELHQRIAKLAFDQQGSQWLQTKLKEDDKQTTDRIFGGIFVYMYDVMSNEHKSHVFARLIERCDEYKLQLIVSMINIQSQPFVKLLFSKHGNFPYANSAKRLIKVLGKSSLVSVSNIISILARHFVWMMADRIACSVVLKCFDNLNFHQNQTLYEELVKNCLALAADDKGCIALNESIDYIKGLHRDQLLDKISTHALFLSQDPSGSYVVERVLELQNPFFTNKICLVLVGNFVNLSMLKYASYIVEKCIKTSFGLDRVLSDFNAYDKLWEVARNKYGNYVIQRALEQAQTAKSPYYEKLVTKLCGDVEKWEKGYGRNVYYMILNSQRESKC